MRLTKSCVYKVAKFKNVKLNETKIVLTKHSTFKIIVILFFYKGRRLRSISHGDAE